MERNHFPQLFNLGKHVKSFEHGDLVQFFEDWTKHEIHSKIKPPLLVVIQTKVLWRKSFLFGLPTNLQVAFDSSHQLTDYKNLKVVEFSYHSPLFLRDDQLPKKLFSCHTPQKSCTVSASWTSFCQPVLHKCLRLRPSDYLGG